jgi:hypothetical protein
VIAADRNFAQLQLEAADGVRLSIAQGFSADYDEHLCPTEFPIENRK